MTILGAVLAGGRSSRFGSDKAWAMLHGRPLIDHARNALRPHVDALVTVGGANGLSDLPGPGLGPLGGIAAALDHAASQGHRCVLTIGCDMPFLPEDLVAALSRRVPAFCNDVPVIGLWPAALGAHLLSHISTAPDRSIRGWARSVGAIPVAAPRNIANVNTQADLAALAGRMLVSS